LLVTEAACVLGTGLTVPMYSYARGRAEDEARSGDLERKAQLYQDRADNIRTVNLSFTGVFAVLAMVGIVQANLAFVPETVETRTRDLPPLTRLTPVVSSLSGGAGALPTGVFVGVRGVAF
jgi:hypothetical protein